MTQKFYEEIIRDNLRDYNRTHNNEYLKAAKVFVKMCNYEFGTKYTVKKMRAAV